MKSTSDCSKTKFRDEKTALDFITKLNKTSARSVRPLRAYLCQRCNTWHLTSQENDYDKLKNEIERLNKIIKEKNNLITTLNNRIHELKLKKK